MRFIRPALLIFGALSVLAGLVWVGQGSGYFPYPASSFMIDQSPWIYRGGVLAVAGFCVILLARRL
jgi:hypothetical protein